MGQMTILSIESVFGTMGYAFDNDTYQKHSR